MNISKSAKRNLRKKQQRSTKKIKIEETEEKQNDLSVDNFKFKSNDNNPKNVSQKDIYFLEV